MRILYTLLFAVILIGCVSTKELKVGDTVSLEANGIPTSSDALYDVGVVIGSGRLMEDIRRDLQAMELRGKVFHVVKGTQARITSKDYPYYYIVITAGQNKDKEGVVTDSYFIKP